MARGRPKKVVVNKSGPLSNKEKKFIEDWQDEKDVKDIALLLKRTVQQVSLYKQEFLSGAPKVTVERTEAEAFKRELHGHSSWKALIKQFTNEELMFFEDDYVEYRKQFKDMTATETKQLHQMITLDVFMQRHNIDRINMQYEVERIEKLLNKEYKRDQTLMSAEEIQYLMHLETQLNGCKAASVSRTKEYKDLLDKHQALLKDLKGTRDQRIKSIEDRGKFISILKQMELEDSRNKMGEVIGLMDLAVEKEKQRLSLSHQYVNGEIDQPILSPESVMFEEDEDAA
jgi:hypothetical protein